MSNMIPPVGVAMACGRTRAWGKNFQWNNLLLCNKAQDCAMNVLYTMYIVYQLAKLLILPTCKGAC